MTTVTFQRFLLTMLMPALVGFCSVISAQNIKQPVTLSLTNVPVARVIDTIAKVANVRFSYNPAAIGAATAISLNVVNKPLGKLLDEMLNPLRVEWAAVSGLLVLKPATAVVSGRSIDESFVTVSGFVRDSLSGEALIGASVHAEGTRYGCAANAYGFYSLTLPAGTYRLVYSFVGYRQVVYSLTIRVGTRFNAALQPRQAEMPLLEVIDQSRSSLVSGGQPGQMKLTPLMLSQLPSFAGQKDVVKSLASLPGIASFGDGSTLFYVRGGASDQNLLMIDEAPIYNPAHLFGFFTAMAPDAISDVEAFKGDFPAQYGGRISSVIHVRTKDGNLYKTGFSGNVGPYTSDFSVEGPILENKSSYFVSARVSNLNWIKPEDGAISNFDFRFFDLNAKFNLKLSENNRLFLTLFTGTDNFTRDGSSSLKTFGINWSNRLGSLRWNHIFGQKLFSNTTIYTSRYDYKLYVSKELDDYWNSSIDNVMAKSDFTWFSGMSNTLKWGVEFGVYYMNPGNVQFSDEEVGKNIPVIPTYRSRSLALYLSDEWKFASTWSVVAGLRLSGWRDVGPTTLYAYDALHQLIDTREIAPGEVYEWFVEPEPRLLLKWFPAPEVNVNISYGRTVQYLQVVTNSISPFTSLEVWVPAGPNIKPQKSDQLSVGLSTVNGSEKYMVSGGFYYRRLTNQIDYADNANLLYNEHLEAELRFGNGRAFGVEAMLRKVTGPLKGWIGYTWSRSLRTTPEVNGGNEYKASYDRTHHLTLCLSYPLSSRIDLSAAWYYLTGAAYTAPTGFMSLGGYVVPVYGERNNARLPDYHRLDLSASCRLHKLGARYQHRLMLSVYNAYARHNPFSINNNKIVTDNGEFVVPADLSGSVEIIPTSLSASGLIPSINYQFKF